jgi:predicted GNAT superfamily acetyltransferase
MQTPTTMETNRTPGTIAIRPIHDPAELRACQEVQRRTWGITEDGYVVPVATLAAASAYGGLVLGAFDGDQLVGFSFAFRGVLDGTPILYSQLTGVLPEAQGSGAGRRIKQWQRAWAREQGLPFVAWAFDPLQAMNAHYNLVALGAIATHYHPNFYGPREDALNPGLPTDRLLCIWPTADPLPAKPDPADAEIIFAVQSRQTDDGGRSLSSSPLDDIWGKPRYIGIEIPKDLNAMRSHGPELLAKWQAAVRLCFTEGFTKGFRAMTFRRGDERAYYILTRG